MIWGSKFSRIVTSPEVASSGEGREIFVEVPQKDTRKCHQAVNQDRDQKPRKAEMAAMLEKSRSER